MGMDIYGFINGFNGIVRFMKLHIFSSLSSFPKAFNSLLLTSEVDKQSRWRT